MASCLITVSGTSGEIQLRYKIGGIDKSPITSGVGTFYIEDTATNVTYTTLYGDAIASSACLTITALLFTCYNIMWKGIKADGYEFVNVTLGATTYILTGAFFPNSESSLPNAVNSLDIDAIKITKYKVVSPALVFPEETLIEHNFLVRVIGSSIPIFKIKNADNTAFIYIYGVVSTCSPIGYIDITMCIPSIAL